MKIPINSLNKIHKYFIFAKESLCVAESCTGGLLGFWLTSLPGASVYFRGGLISYQTEIKIKLLGLEKEELQKEGWVTKACALSMAQGVKNLLNSDWALAVTGVAGPSKGSLGENAGKIAFSICSPKASKSIIYQFEDAMRQEIRQKAGLFALDLLISAIEEHGRKT